jgi:large repetitive protein
MNSQLIIACSTFAGILALAFAFYTKRDDVNREIKKILIILLIIILAIFAYALISSPESVNSHPMVVSLMPNKISPQEAGITIKWTAETFDPEKDSVQYKFLLDGQQKTDWSHDSSWYWTTSDADVGSHTIEIKVKDGNHNADGDDSKILDFTISQPGQPPVLDKLIADKESPQMAMANITWTAYASDKDLEPIYYKFFLNGNPSTDWNTNNRWIWTTSSADVGDNRIEVRIRDGSHAGPDGYDDRKSASFTITAPNTPPHINKLTTDKASSQGAGATITWIAYASDKDLEPIYYKFFLNGNPSTDWNANDQWIWTTSSADVGDNRIEVRIRDGSHAGPDGYDDRKSASFTITAPNTPPHINKLTTDKASPQGAGATITWTAYASDQDLEPISYRFFLNGNPSTNWNTNNQWIWTTSSADAGDNRIEVRVRDGSHADLDSYDSNWVADFTVTTPESVQASSGMILGDISTQQYAVDWNNKGVALANQGKYDDAILAYNNAIELDPNFALAWYNKGRALFSRTGTWNDSEANAPPEAKAAFAKAKELGYNP